MGKPPLLCQPRLPHAGKFAIAAAVRGGNPNRSEEVFRAFGRSSRRIGLFWASCRAGEPLLAAAVRHS